MEVMVILHRLGYKRHSRFLLVSALGSLPGEGRRQAMRTLSYEDGEEGNPPAARQQGAATTSHTSETEEELQPPSDSEILQLRSTSRLQAHGSPSGQDAR